MTNNTPPIVYLCEVTEVDENGRETEGFTDTKVAKTVDDAIAWLDQYDETAEGRQFKYEITETPVIQ